VFDRPGLGLHNGELEPFQFGVIGVGLFSHRGMVKGPARRDKRSFNEGVADYGCILRKTTVGYMVSGQLSMQFQ
jgi:hypothetical protein